VWREGKDPTVETRIKKRKGKGGKGGKGKGGKAIVAEEKITVSKPVNSFFRIFEMPTGEGMRGPALWSLLSPSPSPEYVKKKGQGRKGDCRGGEDHGVEAR
jgi:hypothetical protein